MGVVYYDVEISATGRSLVQRNPTDCVVSYTNLKNEAAPARVGLSHQIECFWLITYISLLYNNVGTACTL